MIARILSAIVALIVVGSVLVFGGTAGVHLLVPVVLVVCAFEYARMAFADGQLGAFCGLVLGSGGLYSAIVYGQNPTLLMVVVFGVVLASQLFVLFRFGPDVSQAADRVGRLLTGHFWIALLSFAVLLREEGLAWLVLGLVIAWASDTGAYFAGRAFGKHKLYPSVSPNKTWEGFFGGVFVCLAAVAAMNLIASMEIPWLHCMVIVATAGTMSVCGDLVESLFKRSFGVKDSGSIMPGHGGLLDRVDSLLFVFPTLYGYVWVIEQGM